MEYFCPFFSTFSIDALLLLIVAYIVIASLDKLVQFEPVVLEMTAFNQRSKLQLYNVSLDNIKSMLASIYQFFE